MHVQIDHSRVRQQSGTKRRIFVVVFLPRVHERCDVVEFEDEKRNLCAIKLLVSDHLQELAGYDDPSQPPVLDQNNMNYDRFEHANGSVEFTRAHQYPSVKLADKKLAETPTLLEEWPRTRQELHLAR